MNQFTTKMLRAIQAHNNFLPLDIALSLMTNNYYEKNESIGSEGDFITAPEISPMFGYCISKWLQQNTSQIQNDFVLIEFGPGNGTLFKSMWASFDANMRNKVRKIIFLEQSKTLQKKQQQIISEIIAPHEIEFVHVRSVEALLKIVQNTFFFLVANEFFDAIPIKQYLIQNEKFHEIGLTHTNSSHYHTPELTLTITKQGQQTLNCSHIERLTADAKEGSIIEFSPARNYALQNILSLFDQNAGGKALIIDYGYFQSPLTNTIQAIKKHKKIQHFLSDIENSDISSLVDFNALHQVYSDFVSNDANSASNLHCSMSTQADFLLSMNIRQLATSLVNSFVNETVNINELANISHKPLSINNSNAITNNSTEISNLAIDEKQSQQSFQNLVDAQLERLVCPENMGTLFKVMSVFSHHFANE